MELGALYYSVISNTDGKPSIMISVNQIAGSNATELIKNVKAALNEAAETFPPGLKMTYVIDASDFLDASIHNVIKTLLEAFLLVFLVVFLFLQSFRSTLIPAVAVPVAVIGAFFVLKMLGFSINLLTLFALVLAIGIVVDDAIVVVEAVHAKLERGAKNAKRAAIETMKEIAPAIVSITLVMASVFVPVSFIGGTTGVFYRQFGLTLAVAIFISAINALTLSPALSALVLRRDVARHVSTKNIFKRFTAWFNRGFDRLTAQYAKALHFLGKKQHRWITVAMIIVFAAVMAVLMKTTPTGFVPQEDSGDVLCMVSLPPGSSLERTDSIVRDAVKLIRAIPEVKHVLNMTGMGFLAGTGSPYGSIVVKLVPWNERKRTAPDIVSELTAKTDTIIGAQFMAFNSPTLRGFGLRAEWN